jgi:hypothetical protein
MMIIYEDSSSPFLSPYNTTIDLAALQAALASADGDMVWEFGIDGTNDDAFWIASTNTDDITALVLQDCRFSAALDVTQYGIGPTLVEHQYLNSSTGWPQFTGETDMPLVFRIEEASSKFFSLRRQTLAAKRVVAERENSLVAAAGRAMQLEGNFDAYSSNQVLPIRTDAGVYLYPIPEPCTLLIWCGLVAGVIGLAWRRRR